MDSKISLEELVNKNDLLRDISIIAGRNVLGLLGIAEWIEETGHPPKGRGGAGDGPPARRGGGGARDFGDEVTLKKG